MSGNAIVLRPKLDAAPISADETLVVSRGAQISGFHGKDANGSLARDTGVGLVDDL
jgi:hypothetical protein